MKLLVTKTNYDASKAIELAAQFHCKTEAYSQDDSITIIKNPQLTDNEFSALAGKLVIAGFTVELDTAKPAKPATPMSEDEQKHIGSFLRLLDKQDKKRKQRAKPKSKWHY